jgi:hypothetical protein
MTFDYVLGRSLGGGSVFFSVTAANRQEADAALVERMLGHGYSTVDLLYWGIVAVSEIRRGG